jgi:hypothetical protein
VAVIFDTTVFNLKIAAPLEDQAYKNLNKDPTEAVEQKAVLLKTSFLSGKVCRQLQPQGLFITSSCYLLLLVSCLAYSSTLKMEAVCSNEMLGTLLTTLCYNPQDPTLHSHCHENLKFSIIETVFLSVGSNGYG